MLYAQCKPPLCCGCGLGLFVKRLIVWAGVLCDRPGVSIRDKQIAEKKELKEKDKREEAEEYRKMEEERLKAVERERIKEEKRGIIRFFWHLLTFAQVLSCCCCCCVSCLLRSP